MILPRTTLFHTPSTAPQSQSQTQTPPPTPSSSTWSFTASLPVSYRIAIFLDASILLFILAIILGLILYIRNRRPAPRRSIPNISIEEEGESLLESKDAYSDAESGLGSRSGGEMSEKRRPGPIRIPSLMSQGVLSPVGILSPSIRTPGEKKRRGHVRWTPSVQGGEVFGIPDLGGNGKGKEKSGEPKKCKCRGRRHPGCWRFELQFENGKPVLGEEREEGLGRPER